MRKSMTRMLRMTATVVAVLAVSSAPGALTTPKAAAQEVPCDAMCVHVPDPPVLACMMGCGDPAPDSQEATLDGPDVPLVALTEELFLLGGASEEEWQAFTEISEVHFDHDGNLVILDRRQNRVVVVGSDGEFRRHISRTGQGPGELRMAIGVGVLHDNRIVVRDVGHNALFLFGADGNFLEQHVAIREPSTRMQSQSVIGSSQTLPALLGSFPDGRLLTARRRGARALDIHTIGRGSREVYRAYTPPPSEVAGSESVSMIRIGEMEVQLPGGILPRRTVFGPPLLAAVLADGEIAVVDSVGYQVKIVRPDDGSVRTVLERPINPFPVTAEMQEAARERESGGGGAQVIATGPGISGAAGRELESAIAQSLVPEMDFGSEVPVISEMGVDHGNRIWIVRSGEDGVSPGPVDVLTPSGGYLGTLSEDFFQMPDAFGPDGMMAYIELGEFDVPVLRVLRLVSLTVAGG